jgi:carbonic anhydrase
VRRRVIARRKPDASRGNSDYGSSCPLPERRGPGQHGSISGFRTRCWSAPTPSSCDGTRRRDRHEAHPPVISALAALDRVRAGNTRFVRAVRYGDESARRLSRWDPDASQEPCAIVLGCSDSRVPVEVVFDQGFGDLFVIRVAGNIVAASQIGSVEFAATRFGTRLVVVLGHSRCGAILATLEELQQPTARQSPNLRSIVDRVRPSVETLLATDLRHDPDALVRQAVRANIRVAAHHLRYGSPVLERLIRRDGLRVVGAEYSLETGLVEFFDGVAEVGQVTVDWPDAEVG